MLRHKTIMIQDQSLHLFIIWFDTTISVLSTNII